MAICNAWNRLSLISSLSFSAESRATTKTGWEGQGEGTVEVEIVDEVTIVFRECGRWTPMGGRQMTFNNTFRWTTDGLYKTLRLEHLRFGPEKPVYLFELEAVSDIVWQSREAHVCQTDCYTARMKLSDDGILLTWTVRGPEKDETIEYQYR